MKKLVLRIVIFLLILSISLIKLNDCILPLEINRTTIKMGLNYNADIYFVGNSHSYWAYNPLIIENETKNFWLYTNVNVASLSLNFAAVVTLSSSLEASYFLIDYLLEKKETDVIFLELFNIYSQSDKKIGAIERIVFDYFPLYYKIKVMNYFYPNITDVIKNIFNFNVHHNFWKDKKFLKKELKFNKLTLSYSKNFTPFNGYVPHFNREPSHNVNGYKNIPEDYFDFNLNVNTKKEIPEENKEFIQKILEKAKRKNKKIIFLLSPFYYQHISSKEASEYVNFIKDLTEKYGFEIINFNNIYTEVNVKREDFKDSGHLNYWGANKLSFYLSNHLLKEYSIQPSINFIRNKNKLHKNKEILSILEKQSEKNIVPISMKCKKGDADKNLDLI